MLQEFSENINESDEGWEGFSIMDLWAFVTYGVAMPPPGDQYQKIQYTPFTQPEQDMHSGMEVADAVSDVLTKPTTV